MDRFERVWKLYYELVIVLENAERFAEERLEEISENLNRHLAEIDRLTKDFPDSLKRPRLYFWDQDLNIGGSRSRHIVEAKSVNEIIKEYKLARKYGTVNKIKDNLKERYNKILKEYKALQPRKKAPTTPKSSKIIQVGKGFTLTDPILPARILTEAKKMSETVYPLLYVLENSIREVIIRIMKNKYGDNWWDTKVHNDIKRKIQDRKRQEEKNPWHGQRGAHEIYYTDLEHLERIVRNNWENFRDVLPDQQWFIQRLREINHSRNPVAHMNPLNQQDIKRIEVYCRDWHDQIKAKISAIPKVYNQ